MTVLQFNFTRLSGFRIPYNSIYTVTSTFLTKTISRGQKDKVTLKEKYVWCKEVHAQTTETRLFTFLYYFADNVLDVFTDNTARLQKKNHTEPFGITALFYTF